MGLTADDAEPVAVWGMTAAVDRASWRAGVLPLAAIATAIGLMYAPSITNPLWLWDHHIILLLAKAPQFAHGLFWHLVHYRIGFQEDLVYFRVLSMPIVFGLAKLFQDHRALYYAAHLLAHFGASVLFYRVALALGAGRTVSLLMALTFAVYAGAGNTANIPFYTTIFLAVLIAGGGVLAVLRYLSDGREKSLVLGAFGMVLATLIYDAFLLLAVALPVLAVALRWRDGKVTGRELRAAAALLAAILLVFCLVITSLQFSPIVQAKQGGVARSLDMTVVELVQGGRIWSAAWFGLWAVLVDLVLFFPGHLLDIFHRGNMPYWDAGTLAVAWLDALAALALTLAGAAGALGLPRWWRLAGLTLVAAGGWFDPRCLLLAVIIVVVAWSGPPPTLGPGLLLAVAAGLLTSFNIALGRADGYNVVAFRHHYVSGFFALLVVASLVGAGWRERPGWQRRVLALTLTACLGLNAWVTVDVLRGVKRDNNMVWSFDHALTTVMERAGPRSLFVAFPTSFVRGLDWRGQPAQDVVFDLLHYHNDPMTRYVNRAPLFVRPDGMVRPNPTYRRDGGEDFLFRFVLLDLPPGRFELFGSSPGEPRVVLDNRQLSLVGRRVSDRAPVRWIFVFPSEMRLPVQVALSRTGRSLQLSANGVMIGRTDIRDVDAYLAWESDDVGLLGPDFERIVSAYTLYDTYIRIGRGISDES